MPKRTSSTTLCDGCHKPFKRIQVHLNHNLVCNSIYASRKSTIDPSAGIGGTLINRSAAKAAQNHASLSSSHILTGQVTTGHQEGHSRQRFSAPFEFSSVQDAGRAASVEALDGDDDPDEHELDDDDDVNPFGEEESLTTPPDLVENGATDPDEGVLELYEELLRLQSNPLSSLAKFSCEEKVHIELLQLLKDLKAPLSAFKHILNWAAKANENGHQFQTSCQPSRETVTKMLFSRYNMHGLVPKEKKLYLPYSKRIVTMVYFDARQVFASLLSCRSLNKDECFMFHEQGDPFAVPDARTSVIGDINSGRCYRETYKKLVKNPQSDMILPCVLAMDKTHIDLPGRLQMEPITISHGLLKHEFRRLPIAMRILGYIYHGSASRKAQKVDLNVDYNEAPNDLPPGVATVSNVLKPKKGVTWPTYMLNEYHMQIAFILSASGFLSLQDKGFKWKLQYKKTVHDVVFHPFVPFIIGDTEGHDRLCGHYTARFAKIKQLCRACECPTEMTGYSKSVYRHRKPSHVGGLVREGDVESLRALSQNYVVNGFNKVRFGQHNARGIFGACPGEILHLITLGWFKYCLESFAHQAGAKKGKKSAALEHYDALCADIGSAMVRKSDRDLPRTNFPKGFSTGSNLMGHEIPGCLLVKLFALHTSSFRQIFPPPKESKNKAANGKGRKKNENGKPAERKGQQKRPSATVEAGNDAAMHDAKQEEVKYVPPPLPKLGCPKHTADWIHIISCLLQWHQWMKQPTIRRSHVIRLATGVRWLIRNVANICPRMSGMRNNTIKMHLALHISEDILDHGVPDVVNSSYAESAHIPLAKNTSRNTQKRVASFTRQAAHRYHEDLAILVANNDVDEFEAKKPPIPLTSSGAAGRRFVLSQKPSSAGDDIMFAWNSPRATDDSPKNRLPSRISKFIMKYCCPDVPRGLAKSVQCFTEFISEEGDRYRGHPNYHGKRWCDHAMINWNLDFPLPGLIHTFVDLRHLPDNTRIRTKLQKNLKPGMYAVLESYDAEDADPAVPNNMIGLYTLHREPEEGRGNMLVSIYLIEVGSIFAPTVGIPDFGNRDSDKYLFLFRRREEWPSAWDHFVQYCCKNNEEESLESEYEEEDDEDNEEVNEDDEQDDDEDDEQEDDNDDDDDKNDDDDDDNDKEDDNDDKDDDDDDDEDNDDDDNNSDDNDDDNENEDDNDDDDDE